MFLSKEQHYVTITNGYLYSAINRCATVMLPLIAHQIPIQIFLILKSKILILPTLPAQLFLTVRRKSVWRLDRTGVGRPSHKP